MLEIYFHNNNLQFEMTGVYVQETIYGNFELAKF